jgi:hypothetical protein
VAARSSSCRRSPEKGAEKIACHSGTGPSGRARNPSTQAKPLFSLARVPGFRARGRCPRPGMTTFMHFLGKRRCRRARSPSRNAAR